MNLKEAMGYLDQLKQLRRFVATHPSLSQTYRRLTLAELAAQPLDTTGPTSGL
jgi:hypothetical protein